MRPFLVHASYRKGYKLGEKLEQGAQAIEHKEREKCPWAWAEDKEK
jgi:hypothetical protein